MCVCVCVCVCVCTATYLPSLKLSKLNEQDMQDIVSKDEVINFVLLWTPSHGWAGVEQPARTYLHSSLQTQDVI